MFRQAEDKPSSFDELEDKYSYCSVKQMVVSFSQAIKWWVTNLLTQYTLPHTWWVLKRCYNSSFLWHNTVLRLINMNCRLSHFIIQNSASVQLQTTTINPYERISFLKTHFLYFNVIQAHCIKISDFSTPTGYVWHGPPWTMGEMLSVLLHSLFSIGKSLWQSAVKLQTHLTFWIE